MRKYKIWWSKTEYEKGKLPDIDYLEDNDVKEMRKKGFIIRALHPKGREYKE